jgi:hypothetical protein
MDFNDIVDHLKSFGVPSVVISGIIIISWIFSNSTKLQSGVMNIFFKIFDSVLKKEASRKSVTKTIKESDVLNHDIFNYIDFWVYSQVPTLQFSTEYRTVVFRKYLTTYLRSYRENIYNWISDKSFETMDESELWDSLLSLINRIIYDYEKNMAKQEIPSVVIEKMKIRNNDTISLTIDLLQGICSSEFYYSDKNLLKVYSILNILLSILENTISSASPICNSINGQLKGKSIEGETEPY